MKYAVCDPRSAEHWSAIRDSLVQATGSRWAAHLIQSGRQETSLPPAFWLETLAPFLFLWNAFTPQQYYSLLIAPSLILSSLKLKRLCFFPKNIFFFFPPRSSPLSLKGQSILILSFFNSEKMFAFQGPKVFCVDFDDIFIKTSVLCTLKSYILFIEECSLCSFEEIDFCPCSSAGKKKIASLQHTLFPGNYQYKIYSD